MIKRKIFTVLFISLIMQFNVYAVFEMLNEDTITEVRGIVQNINVKEGKITLFDELGRQNKQLFRTYNFKYFYNIPVIKDGVKIPVSGIRLGDTVFLRLDKDGYVIDISCVSNYIKEYGVISNKEKNYVTIISDDGDIKKYPIDNSIPISKGGRGIKYEDLVIGERISLVVNRTMTSVNVISVTAENNDRSIDEIYFATVDGYNAIKSMITVRDIKYFENGVWAYTETKGYKEISFSDDTKIYYNDMEIGNKIAMQGYMGKQAFIATKKGLGGEENAVIISFIKETDSRYNIFDESIKTISREKDQIGINRNSASFHVNEGAIILKNDKLVSLENLSINDEAFVVSYDIVSSKNQNVYIIEVAERETSEGFWLYIGRIERINEYVDFTINSYSRFISSKWQYDNRRRTFEISDNIRILDEDGIVGIRDFTEYSSRDYIDKIVMVVVSGGEAIAVSEAPQSDNRIRGRVNIDYGQTVTDKIHISNVKLYDHYTGRWEDGRNGEIIIKNYTIILKNGRPVGPEEIKRGDTVTIMKPYWGSSGEAALISIE